MLEGPLGVEEYRRVMDKVYSDVLSSESDFDSKGPPVPFRAARAAFINLFCSDTDKSVILSANGEKSAQTKR